METMWEIKKEKRLQKRKKTSKKKKDKKDEKDDFIKFFPDPIPDVTEF